MKFSSYLWLTKNSEKFGWIRFSTCAAFRSTTQLLRLSPSKKYRFRSKPQRSLRRNPKRMAPRGLTPHLVITSRQIRRGCLHLKRGSKINWRVELPTKKIKSSLQARSLSNYFRLSRPRQFRRSPPRWTASPSRTFRKGFPRVGRRSPTRWEQ